MNIAPACPILDARTSSSREILLSLASTDIPQANDPERVVRLARHLTSAAGNVLPAEFAHPRDRHFYLGALRALRALDGDERATAQLSALAATADPKASFGAVFALSPVGCAWLAWAGCTGVDGLDPATAATFLAACSDLSPSTAARRASTLRRWVEWCQGADSPAAAPKQAGTVITPEPPDRVEPPPAIDPAPEPTPRVLPTPVPRTDPNRLLAGLARARVKLELGTVELCFLSALYLRSDRAAVASFEDDALVDVYEQVCDLVHPGADNPRKRATHAIQRLQEDRLLQRVDGSGLVRTGEYTLTGLAAGVVEFFLRDETLTKESLVLLTRILHLNLAEIRNHARAARGDAWNSEVVGPLSVTIRDLVDGIRRRQRGLDADQEEVQERISHLLDEQWLLAVGVCEQLLDTTSATLRELNEVLLRDTHQFLTVLQEIQRLAGDAERPEAEEAAQRVIEQVDVIAAWGSARQRAWSEYYQYVHRFLQDVVRLDPDRALSQRLRDLITAFGGRPFVMSLAHAPSIRLLRPLQPRDDRPAVARPHEVRERGLDEVLPEDRRAWLEERVYAALAGGADHLAEVTARVLVELPEAQHALTIGQIAALVAELAHVTREREARWTAVSTALEIGDWTLDGMKEAP